MKFLSFVLRVFLGTLLADYASSSSCQPFNRTLFDSCVQAGYNVSEISTSISQNELSSLIANMQNKFKNCSSLSSLMTCSVQLPKCSADKSMLPCKEVCKSFVADCQQSSSENEGLIALFRGICELLPLSKCLPKPSNLPDSHSETVKCERLVIKQCQNAGYNFTSVSEKYQKLRVESSLIFQNSDVNSTLRKIICMEIAPPCDAKNNRTLLVPCRSMCDEAFNKSRSKFLKVFKAPEYCSAFPENTTVGGKEYCSLQAWPENGYWPSSLWTSLNTSAQQQSGSIDSTEPSLAANDTTPAPTSNVTTPVQSSNVTTPAPSSNVTTSAASCNVTMPAPSSNVTKSAPSSNGTTPAPPSNVTTPTLSSNVTTHAPSSNVTTTAPSSNVTTPASSTNVTTPAPSSNVTTTAPSSNVTTPASSTNVTTPAPSSNVTTPAPSSNVTTPAPSSNVTTTAPSSNVTTPAPSSNVTTPASSTNVTTPAPSSNVTTPTPSSNVTTTAPSSNVTTPTLSSNVTTPTQKSNITTTAPKSNSTTRVPTSKVTTAAPKTNSSTAAPTSKSKTNGSTTESTPKVTTAAPTSTVTSTELKKSSTSSNSPSGTKGSPPVVSAHKGGKMSAGAIAGTVVGIIVLLVAIVVAVICFRRHRLIRSQYRHSLMVDMDEL